MMAVAAIRIGLRRDFSMSPMRSALTGLPMSDLRLLTSASAAAACAARRAAAMKSDFPASVSLCRVRSLPGWPRSSRTRFMIALRSGAPEPGSSGRFASFGSSGVVRSTLGASSRVGAGAHVPGALFLLDWMIGTECGHRGGRCSLRGRALDDGAGGGSPNGGIRVGLRKSPVSVDRGGILELQLGHRALGLALQRAHAVDNLE